MKCNIYFDNASSTKISDNVINEITDVMKNIQANPSSLHKNGRDAKKIIENARDTLANCINCTPENIIFTSSGTESNNLAISSIKSSKCKTIITSKIEHDSILNTLTNLEEYDFIIKYVDVDSYGRVDLNSLKQLVDKDTCLVCLSMVNSVIGVINEVEEISSIIKSINKNTLIHIDAVQALGTLEIDTNKLSVDFLSFSAHKIHGPKGVGGLYVKNINILNPQIFGGHQEFGVRAGTENLYGIHGFSIAVKEIKNNSNHVASLKEYIINNLKISFPSLIENSNEYSVKNIINISLLNIPSEYLVTSLSKNGIYISSNFACSNSVNDHSQVVYEISKDMNVAKSSVRISLSKYNNLEECKVFIDIISKCISDYMYLNDL